MADSAQKSIERSANRGAHAAMAHRLAVPLIYTDLTSSSTGVPLDTVCAFARLDHGKHLGEQDNEGIRFIFVIIEHENLLSGVLSPTRSQKNVSTAEAIAFVMRDVEAYDHFVTVNDWVVFSVCACACVGVVIGGNANQLLIVFYH